MSDHVAFVAGATGYTGREVVRALRERGIETHAHVRHDSPRLDEWRARFDELGATVNDSAWSDDAMHAALEAVAPTLVFSLLGTTRARAREEERDSGTRPTYDTVDYGLTAVLLRAAAKLPRPPRFVYLSSAGVPDREPSPTSYMHARWQVERELAESPLPYTVARPSIITGSDREDGRLGERLGGALADGALAVVGVLGGKRLRDRYHSTDNRTLAEALVRIALDPARARTIVESEDLR